MPPVPPPLTDDQLLTMADNGDAVYRDVDLTTGDVIVRRGSPDVAALAELSRRLLARVGELEERVAALEGGGG